MTNFIITNNRNFFEKIGNYNYCSLNDMVLPLGIAIDTETTSLYPRKGDIFAVQIGTGQDNYLIDLQDHNNGLSFKEIIPYIKDKVLIAHNATFDIGFLNKYGFYPDKVYDTIVASKLLYNGFPPSTHKHAFAFVMDRELNLKYDKSEQKSISKVQLRTAKSIQYCFNDVDELLRLARHLYKKLSDKNMLGTYELHNNFIHVLAYMESCGLPINEHRLREKIVRDKKRLTDQRDIVTKYIITNLPKYKENTLFNGINKLNISLTSPKQMLSVFKDFNIQVLNYKGKESIEEDVIKRTKHEFVDLWLKFQKYLKNVTTYGENILNKIEGGRVYTTYNIMVDTARLSTKKLEVSFLTFPATEEMRSCFEAPKGNKMVVCDYSGQENCVGADLHRDPVMVQSVIQGLDLHCAFARLIYTELKDLDDKEIEDNHSEKRTFAKSPRFAFAYGGSGFTVANRLNLSIQEGDTLERLYKDLHPVVYKWGEKELEVAEEKGYIKSVGGFRLYLPNYTKYREVKDRMKNFGKSFWDDYNVGKKEYKNLLNNRERLDKGEDVEPYFVTLDYQYRLYIAHKKEVSWYYSKKSQYMRLCLNSKIQTIAAHQTKSALIELYEIIKIKKHVGIVRICVSPHDEIVLDVPEFLAEEYKGILETVMRECGNKFLTSGLFEMKAKAKIGTTWYEAK